MYVLSEILQTWVPAALCLAGIPVGYRHGLRVGQRRATQPKEN